MRMAYARYSGERGFTAEQFRQTASEVAGADLTDRFHDAVASTKELDYSAALDWFGLRFGSQWTLEAASEATDLQRRRLAAWLAGSPPRP